MPGHQLCQSSNKRGVKPHSQCEAAFDAGALFNKLGFILWQAWLLPDENMAHEVGCLWGRLALIVRELVSDCGARDRLHDTVLEAEQSWHRQLESPDRQLRRLQEGAALLEAFYEGGYERAREDGCQWLLEPVTRLFNELQRCIELDLSPGLAEVFRLGAFVDSGVHPVTVYREMFPPGQEMRLDKIRSLVWVTQTPVPPASHLPSVKVDRSRKWPEPRWWDLLRQRCAELGAGFEPPEGFESVEKNQRAESWDEVTASVRRHVARHGDSSNVGLPLTPAARQIGAQSPVTESTNAELSPAIGRNEQCEGASEHTTPPRPMKPSIRRAYLAYHYALKKLEQSATTHVAWKYLREYGIDDDQLGLAGYEVPENYKTFETQVSKGCNAMGERRHSSRAGRPTGRSVVHGSKIEFGHDDEG